jgi:TolB-like protein
MFTDIAGYTALMERNEQRAFQLLDENRKIQRPLIQKFNGKWLKEIGDGILASFNTVSDAVYCAGAIQKACEDNPALSVRIGIHDGEVVFKDGDVFGSGVNIASRLESIAPVGGILISGSGYRNIKNKEGIKTEFLREETLKNVEEPIKIYQVKVEKDEPPETPPAGIEPPTEKGPSRLPNKKGIIIGAAVIILLLLGYTGYQFISNESPANVPAAAEVEIDKSIAVLPFVNMSNDPDQQYFSDGIMEAILNDLTKIGALKVISRTSVMQYRNTEKTSPQIAEELGVAYLLEGGVHTVGGKVRVNAQLIDAVQDKHVWSENYDRELADIFGIMSEVAQINNEPKTLKHTMLI